MLRMPTPPISKDCQLFPGGFGPVGREVSTTGGTVAEGWLARALAMVGDDSEAAWDFAEGDVVMVASLSLAAPLGATTLIALGF